ncbi:MAG: S8/S53 family peptidase [Bdellovibrionales bacterium]
MIPSSAFAFESIDDFCHPAHPSVTAQGCEVIPTCGRPAAAGGRLSPFWAQELIGADLARQALKSMKIAKRPRLGLFEYLDIRAVPSSNLPEEIASCAGKIKYTTTYEHENDGRGHSSVRSVGDLGETDPCWKMQNGVKDPAQSQFLYHGSGVANLLVNPVVGVSPISEITAHQMTLSLDQSANATEEARAANYFNAFEAAHVDIICSSFSDDTTKSKAFQDRIARSNIHYFEAAGNQFPLVASAQRQSAILVGSLSPLGLVSGMSSEGSDVLIYAPSSYYLLSYKGPNQDLDFFGETSGAQPLVCGSAANAVAVQPHLTRDNLRRLILQTGIPIPAPNSQLKDRVMVNSYGLLLNLAMGKQNLNIMAQAEYEKARSKIQSKDTCEKRQAFDSLRRAFLLAPENTLYGATLARFYRSQGYPLNAAFIENLTHPQVDRWMPFVNDDIADIRNSVLRDLIYRDGPSTTSVFLRALQNVSDPRTAQIAAMGLLRRGEQSSMESVLFKRLSYAWKEENWQEVGEMNRLMGLLTVHSQLFFEFCADKLNTIMSYPCLRAASQTRDPGWKYIKAWAPHLTEYAAQTLGTELTRQGDDGQNLLLNLIRSNDLPSMVVEQLRNQMKRRNP